MAEDKKQCAVCTLLKKMAVLIIIYRRLRQAGSKEGKFPGTFLSEGRLFGLPHIFAAA